MFQKGEVQLLFIDEMLSVPAFLLLWYVPVIPNAGESCGDIIEGGVVYQSRTGNLYNWSSLTSLTFSFLLGPIPGMNSEYLYAWTLVYYSALAHYGALVYYGAHVIWILYVLKGERPAGVQHLMSC